MPTCKICQKSFDITALEKSLCRKLDFPLPQVCPDCSFQQQCAFRNDMFLYKRKCDLSGKTLLSHYAPSAFFPVYKEELWKTDTFDAMAYAQDFDFHQSFFEQYQTLSKKVPRPHRFSLGGLENSEYTDATSKLKDCYMIFSASENENCYYGEFAGWDKDCIDFLGCMKSELCYEIMQSEECYQCFFINNSTKCSDSYFLDNCVNCSHCFGCVNIKNKEYYWFNQPLSEKMYNEHLKKYKLSTFSGLTKAHSDFEKFLLTQPKLFVHGFDLENSSGDYIYNCKDCNNAYITHESENSVHVFHSYYLQDTARITSSDAIEIGYQTTMCSDWPNKMYDMSFCVNVFGKSRSLRYCDYCYTCEDCFGCIGLKKKQYCILNKQYTKEEYRKMVTKIIAYMKNTHEWGEFFPSYCSPFAYNETYANDFYPLSKEQALRQGYSWQDHLPQPVGKETLLTGQIPGDIHDASDSILQDIILCSSCGRNYKLIKQELDFYKKFELPIPRKCFRCRHVDRLHKRNPFHLWKRQCMCAESEHDHKGKCQREFQTSYPPDNPAKVYCKDCYNNVVNT